MNSKLSEQRIRSLCRELMAKNKSLSGRGLCKELRQRFGAVGKTERVFRIWREEKSAVVDQRTTPEESIKPTASTLPLGNEDAYIRALEDRLKQAEQQAAANLVRAELAELREMAHQDQWAAEVDRLRMALKAGRGPKTAWDSGPIDR